MQHYRVDLHCHTNCSDGSLSPEQLWALAIEREIDILAVTDHDNCDAIRELRALPLQPNSPQLIAGIEWSTLHAKQPIHLLGLHFDIDDPTIKKWEAYQQDIRITRAKQISDKLSKIGVENALEGALTFASEKNIGRPHFAQYLIQIGMVKDANQAFKKYLGRGKLGDVKVPWPSLEEMVQVIKNAGGLSCIAHPLKYKMTRNKIVALISDFKDMGGDAVEVISGMQPMHQTNDLAKLCDEYQLLASSGSDFHQPSQVWASLGQQPPLPPTVKPIWQHWSVA